MEQLSTQRVTKATLVQKVEALKARGWRFVTITCLELDETGLEFIYHFDRELEMTHLRMAASKTEVMPSISACFFAAFLVENEIIDQFGTTFENLVLDFGGTLYLDDDDEIQATPFCKYGIKKAEPGQ